MASPTASGSATRLAFKKEATYGTPPASGYFFMPGVNWRLPATQAFQEVDLIGQGRDPGRPEKDPVLNVRGSATVPLDLRNVGSWLELLLGAANTSGGPAPYTHVFESGADALLSAAVEAQFPDLATPLFSMARGVMVNGGTINFTPQGRAYLELDLLGADVAVPGASSGTGGSETVRPIVRFSQAHATIKREGSAIAKVISATLPMVNNIEQAYYVGGAGAVGDLNPGLFQSRGQIVARLHNGLTATLFADAAAGDTFEFELAFVIDAENSLTFAMDISEVAKPSTEIAGPGGIQVTMDWAASANPGTTPSVVATLVNDVASY